MVDLREYRRLAWDAANRTGGTVVEFRMSDEVTPNFHQAVIDYPDQSVAVVCTRDEGLVAVALPRSLKFSPSRESGPLTFVDMPALTAALIEAAQGGMSFRVLTTAELAGPVDPAKWPGISSQDLRYWRPGSLGDALFNDWD